MTLITKAYGLNNQTLITLMDANVLKISDKNCNVLNCYYLPPETRVLILDCPSVVRIINPYPMHLKKIVVIHPDISEYAEKKRIPCYDDKTSNNIINLYARHSQRPIIVTFFEKEDYSTDMKEDNTPIDRYDL